MSYIPECSRDDVTPWETRVGGTNLLGRIRDDVTPCQTRARMSYIPECSRDDDMPCQTRDEMQCLVFFLTMSSIQYAFTLPK
jgi:hypothetical protein